MKPRTSESFHDRCIWWRIHERALIFLQPLNKNRRRRFRYHELVQINLMLHDAIMSNCETVDCSNRESLKSCYLNNRQLAQHTYEWLWWAQCAYCNAESRIAESRFGRMRFHDFTTWLFQNTLFDCYMLHPTRSLSIASGGVSLPKCPTYQDGNHCTVDLPKRQVSSNLISRSQVKLDSGARRRRAGKVAIDIKPPRLDIIVIYPSSHLSSLDSTAQSLVHFEIMHFLSNVHIMQL